MLLKIRKWGGSTMTTIHKMTMLPMDDMQEVWVSSGALPIDIPDNDSVSTGLHSCAVRRRVCIRTCIDRYGCAVH